MRRLAAALLLLAPVLPGCGPSLDAPSAPVQSYPGLDGKYKPGAFWVPMAPGERWIFSTSWNGIPVGTASIECTDVREVLGRKALHVVCTVQPNGYIEAIYHLRDEIASDDIDLETGSAEIHQHIEEGERCKDE